MPGRKRTFFTILHEYRWVFPAAVLAVIVVAALVPRRMLPQDAWDLKQLDLNNSNLAPPWSERGRTERMIDGALDRRFFLGTDEQGRDMLSAILLGLRVSLFVGVAGTAISLVTGVSVGLMAGYYRGRLDTIVMRIADVQLSFPSVLIALFLMALWGQGLGKIILAVSIVHWVIYARIARGIALAEREKDYISAIQSIGAPAPRIIFHHLLPNLIGPILVVCAVEFASVVILEATLSYLGLGVPITRPSLGMLIKFGYKNFSSGYWWIWFFPGIALVALVVSINWLADVLRNRFTIEL